MMGSLLVLYQIVKTFEYKNAKEREPLIQVHFHYRLSGYIIIYILEHDRLFSNNPRDG